MGELCTNKRELLSQPGLPFVRFPAVTNSWGLHGIAVTDQEPRSAQSGEKRLRCS